MALQRAKFTEVPPDAVLLTEEEAFRYQTKVLNGWQHPLDVFGFKYGYHILAGAGFVGGFLINSFYRRKFKLLHYGRAATYLPVCLIPAGFAAITHLEFVLKDVVLQKRETCPVCVELRASAIQALIGCGFPLLLSPLANLSMVHKYGTYNIPDIISQPKQVLSFVKTKTIPIYNLIFALFVAQALIGSTVTYLEASSVTTVNTKLALLETELENS